MITTTDPSSPATRNTASFNATYVWMISAVAAMGGLLFGYDWVVIGGAAKFYEAFFHLKDTAVLVAQDAGFWEKVKANAISPTGWAQSCALLGCLAGALVSGALSDRFGRKPMLILAAANFVASSIGIALAQSFPAFVAWRILGGMSIGLASNISPMYISEIAPPARRGLLVAINQLTIVIGVLAAQFVNWCIARPVPDGLSPAEFAASWNAMQGWRWMFAACAVPAVLFLVGSLFVPESPRWLRFARCWFMRTSMSASGNCWNAGCWSCWGWASFWPCFNNGAASTSSSTTLGKSLSKPAITSTIPSPISS